MIQAGRRRRLDVLERMRVRVVRDWYRCQSYAPILSTIRLPYLATGAVGLG